jgi:DNA-binding NarL/FixJ family response regulator
LSRGLANKSIARELSVSEHTVKFHVSSIYSKLQVQTRAEAVSCGARLGLLRL